MNIGNLDAAHRKVRENIKERRNNANMVRDKSAKALTESRDNVDSWVEYIEPYASDVVADLIENESELQNDDRRI